MELKNDNLRKKFLTDLFQVSLVYLTVKYALFNTEIWFISKCFIIILIPYYDELFGEEREHPINKGGPGYDTNLNVIVGI